MRFAVNAFVILRDTEEEAIRTLQEIQGKADKEAVEVRRPVCISSRYLLFCVSLGSAQTSYTRKSPTPTTTSTLPLHSSLPFSAPIPHPQNSAQKSSDPTNNFTHQGFRQQVQNAGASTSNKTGMWANSKFEDLVQYNDGFKTKLIGTTEQIVDRVLLLRSLGVRVLLCAFLVCVSFIVFFLR